MRLLLAILLTVPLSALAQFGAGVAAGRWEPLNIVTKASIVACYDAGNASTITLNGTGVQQLRSRVVGVTNHLNQATAGNQPLISRSDNLGNLILQSETFSTTWTLARMSAFGATDTGAAGAGSFANTSRTLDPLGGNTADFIQEDGTAANNHYIYQNLPTCPVTITNVFSFFCKADAQSLIALREVNSTIGVGFDLSAGTTFTVTGLTPPDSYAMVSNGVASVNWNGFYLCSITKQYVAGAIFGIFGITNSGGTYTRVYDGNNTKGFFLWGASVTSSAWDQVNGPTSALGYIRTTTSPIFPGLNSRTTLYCDGAAHYLKAAAFALNQPTESYRLCMPWTWTLNDAAFDGNSSGSGKLYQSATTPNIRMNAGTDATEFVPPAAGTWRVTSTVFDGANSRMSTNNGAWMTSDAGTNNMGGFTLSANGANTAFWNGQVAYQILCSKTNGAPEANFLRTCLMRRAGL